MLIDVANHRLIGGDFLIFMVHSYKLLLFLLFCFFFFLNGSTPFLKKKKKSGSAFVYNTRFPLSSVSYC